MDIVKKFKKWFADREKKKPWCVSIDIGDGRIQKSARLWACKKNRSYFEEEACITFHQFYVDGALSMEEAIEEGFLRHRRIKEIENEYANN